jgi:hypothetical protein
MKEATSETIEFRDRWLALGFKNRVAVAAEIGVTADAVKKWERGERPIPKYAWIALERTEKLKKRKKAGA